MQEKRKQIIRDALQYEIEDINTYSGYKGDLIVKVTTKEENVMKKIREYALSLGIQEVAVKRNPNLVVYEIYCVTKDENIYDIKLKDDESDEKHEHFEDVWSKTTLD